MGLLYSRLNLDYFSSNRAHSVQDGCGGQVYLLNKDYFSNYFLMGGERFEINDPDYIFGDICDLNFLSRTKPFPLPYKQAQQKLLSILNAKPKTNTKVSARISRIPYAFERITGARTTTNSAAASASTEASRSITVSGGRRQAFKTHSSSSSACLSSNNQDPSRPLVMLINIRKETVRLIKSSAVCDLDSDFNSLTDSISCNGSKPEKTGQIYPKAPPLAETSKQHSRSQLNEPQQATTTIPLRHVTQISKHASSIDEIDHCETGDPNIPSDYSQLRQKSRAIDSNTGSLLSISSSAKSCYRSVKNSILKSTDAPHPSDSSEVDDDEFKDALNDTDLYLNENEDDDNSEDTQQQQSLLCENTINNATGNQSTNNPTNRVSDLTGTTITRDIPLSHNEHMKGLDMGSSSDLKDIGSRVEVILDEKLRNESRVVRNSNCDGASPSMGTFSKHSSSSRTTEPTTTNGISNNITHSSRFMNKVYNIEFIFDAEVDCYIKIFYFCTKEVRSDGINYKPQHATYKSKVYYYKKGLNQKFEQPQHTFQPYLFDEDLLIYKPVDINGNYNSGAVFPIVIHCVALQGSSPRQSQSLIATIEKMDDSYAIKPLKQLIFVDGIQYILQDIFGIENKQLIKPSSKVTSTNKTMKKRPSYKKVSGLREKSYSLQSNLNSHYQTTTTTNRPSDLEFMDKGSLASIGTSSCFKMSPTNSLDKLHLQRTTDNSFECVVCLAEERDTMLLPCRHLCLCGSCAQSLRYQASTCPICRCPFKAALNLRTIQKKASTTSSSATAIASTTFSNNDCKTVNLLRNKKVYKHSHSTTLKTSPSASSSFMSLNIGNVEDGRQTPAKTTSFITSIAPTN